MTPSYYVDGLIATLANIDNSIKTLSMVMDDNKPDYRNLLALRESIIEKIEGWASPLGLVLSQKNHGLGTWVINKQSGKYYQFESTTSRQGQLMVNLVRHNGSLEIITDQYNKEFRMANPAEVAQHEKFLADKFGRTTLVSVKGKPDIATSVKVKPTEKMQSPVGKPSIDPSKCDFYMVTCTGQYGSRVRHDNYESAEKEALRVANLKKHSAWIVGVVAKIEPEVKTTFNVKKSW